MVNINKNEAKNQAVKVSKIILKILFTGLIIRIFASIFK